MSVTSESTAQVRISVSECENLQEPSEDESGDAESTALGQVC